MTEFHFCPTEIRKKKVLSNEALYARKFKKNYDSESSIATIFFEARYGHPLNKVQMTYVANEITRMKPTLKPSFEELRHKPQLTKWFEDHLNEIMPYLGFIQLKPTKKMMINSAFSKKRQKEPLIDKEILQKAINEMNAEQIQQETPHYTNTQSANLFNSFNYLQRNQLQVFQLPHPQPMNLFNSFNNVQQSQFQVHQPPPSQPMNSFNLFINEQHNQHQAQLTSNLRNLSNVEKDNLHSSSVPEYFPSLSNIEGEENLTTTEMPDQSNNIEFSLHYFENSRTDEILQKWNEDENEFEMNPSF